MPYDGVIGGRPARRDWDYVNFADYEHDTKEIVERSAAIIQDVRNRLVQAERLLAEVIIAAGGQVKLPLYELQNTNISYEMTQECDMSNMTLVFRARRT